MILAPDFGLVSPMMPDTISKMPTGTSRNATMPQIAPRPPMKNVQIPSTVPSVRYDTQVMNVSVMMPETSCRIAVCLIWAGSMDAGSPGVTVGHLGTPLPSARFQD